MKKKTYQPNKSFFTLCSCRISPANPAVYYGAFLAPACLILLVNCVIFTIVTKVLLNTKSNGKVGSESGITAAQVRGAMTVMVLLGITWVFGTFAIGEAKLPFAYIFCIANSLQGFLIFIIRCLHYKEARAAWYQLITTGTFKKRRGRDVISNSQSHSGVAVGYKSKSTTAFSANSNNSNNVNNNRKPKVLREVAKPILAENGFHNIEIPFIDNDDDDMYVSRM